MAPVSAEASVGKKQTVLQVRFHAAGTNVGLSVSGIDGLSLLSQPSLLSEGVVAAGEMRRFTVEYEPIAGRSALVLSARGRFDGREQARVMTFTVGDGPLPSTGETLRTDDGDAVKVMPTKQ